MGNHGMAWQGHGPYVADLLLGLGLQLLQVPGGVHFLTVQLACGGGDFGSLAPA